MFIDILFIMFLGIAFGTLTGLVPGIHPNTVFIMMVSVAVVLSGFIATQLLLVFIISVAVANTFTDFLPSVIFGAPDPSTALSVLPGHKFLLEGRGHEAVSLTVIGGLGVALLIIITLPILVLAIPHIYLFLRPVLHIFLIFIVAWIILTEKGWRRPISLLIFLLSGMLGVVTLNAFPSGSMLFPSLTGLFAFSTMITSYRAKSTIPHQERCEDIRGDHRTGILSGWLGGWLAGMLPGVGASQAGVIAAQILKTRRGDFLTALGGINTSNILFTFIMFYSIGKTRSGAAWALSQFTESVGLWSMLLLIFTGLTACFVSAVITLGLSRMLLGRIRELDYGRLTLSVMMFLIFMVAILSGLPGIIAAVTGTFMGLLSIITGVKRSHMMGYLLLPTILYFSGLSPVMMVTLGI